MSFAIPRLGHDTLTNAMRQRASNIACILSAMLPLLFAPVVQGATQASSADNTSAQLAAARSELDDHRPVSAARYWLQVVQVSDDEMVVEEATRACYDNHQLHAALSAAQKWLQLNDTSQEAHEIAGFSAIQLFQPEVALPHFKALIDSAYITPAAGFMALSAKLEAGDSAVAIEVFTKLADQYPDLAEAHYVVALLAAKLENLALMRSEAERAQNLAPYWSPAGLLLARAQLAAGQTEAALATAQAVVKRDSTIATRSEYASLLLQADHANDAVTIWRELEAQTDGDNSPAIRALALLDFRLGNYQSSFNRFNRLLNTGRNISESIFYLGNIAERTGALDEARQLYDRVQDGEFASAAQLRVAKLIQQSDGLTAALTFLQSYGDANPDDMLLSYRARADLLNEADAQSSALKIYDEAVAQYPDDASIRLARAFQLIRMDKIKDGLKTMRELQRERPRDPAVLNALGYTLVDNDKDLKVASGYVADALQQSPDSGAILDSMGWALFKLGRKDEALEYLQRAATHMADADLDLHLGEVLWSLGRKDEAVKAWQAGAARFPDDKTLADRLKRATGR
jgi:tetratricopeptide (TPR) repeat protein